MKAASAPLSIAPTFSLSGGAAISAEPRINEVMKSDFPIKGIILLTAPTGILMVRDLVILTMVEAFVS